MANICSNTLAFYSVDENVVTDFKRLIEDSIKKSAWIGNIATALGFTKDLPFDSSGCIDEVDDIEENDKDRVSIYAFKVWSETKWTPCHTFWCEVLDKYNEKNNLTENCIYYDFIADEPGEEIYVNTDKDGIFFSDRVKIEISYKGNWLDGIYLCSYDNEEVIEEIIDACSEVNIPEEIVNKALENALTGKGIDIICDYIKENGDYEIYVHFYDEDYYV